MDLPDQTATHDGQAANLDSISAFNDDSSVESANTRHRISHRVGGLSVVAIPHLGLTTVNQPSR